MSDLDYWTKKRQEAERELEGATRRSDVNAAAARLMWIKAELKALQRAPTRPASGAAAPAASS